MKITLNGNLEKKIKEVKGLIEKNKGTFDGDIENGIFSVKGVKGEYIITNNIIEIEITDKPFLVSTKIIENKLKDYFK